MKNINYLALAYSSLLPLVIGCSRFYKKAKVHKAPQKLEILKRVKSRMTRKKMRRINVRNEIISNSSNQKLLGIPFNSNFRFDYHVASLSKKALQKLNALTRVAQYMSFAQRISIMKAFICSQFGYCPLNGCFTVGK